MGWIVLGFFVATCAIGGFAYFILLCRAARDDIRGAPRADMLVCDTHGAIPASAALTLINEPIDQEINGKMVRRPLLMCPICYQEQIKRAKLNYK